MILDHVVVVEQPFSGGPHVRAPVGGGREPGVGAFEDSPGAVEAVEEGGPPARAPAPVEPLAGGQSLGPLGQMLGAEQIATDRPREQVFAGVGAAGNEAGDESGRLELSDGADPWRMFDAV